MAWSAYNELLVPRFTDLVAAGVKTLFMNAVRHYMPSVVVVYMSRPPSS